jgi:hypothetical protein
VLQVAPGLADDSASGTLYATIGTGKVVVGYPAPARA